MDAPIIECPHVRRITRAPSIANWDAIASGHARCVGAHADRAAATDPQPPTLTLPQGQRGTAGPTPRLQQQPLAVALPHVRHHSLRPVTCGAYEALGRG